MKHRLLISLLFLTLAPTALASSTWYVDGVHGKNKNDCKTPQTACKTIGHAISLASSGDSIMVAAATYTENLTIGFSLKVVGAGARTTVIDGGAVGTVVTISSASAHVSLSKLTIQNGVASLYGGGIYNPGNLTINNSTVSGNSSANSGGGIYSSGTLRINNSAINGNSAYRYGASFGGGIYNSGNLTINKSTVSGNRAAAFLAAFGGGIYNGGVLTISNSTFSGNVATGGQGNSFVPTNGGGIASFSGALTIISNSTISGNAAVGKVHPSFGGGIWGTGTATLQNCVVANNSGGNCRGTMTSDGYNLSSDGTCNFNNSGDLNNTDPKLGTLQNNGGPTQTQALLSGSPAIDAGNPSGCTDGKGHLLKTDQRGKPRPDKEDTSGCDMGAYERQKD
jgi:predicted outer membrane repeat protein